MNKATGIKLLLAIVIIASIGLLVTPKVIGSNIESLTVDSLLDMVPVEVAALLTIPSPAMETGWFRSKAQIDISFEPLDNLAGQNIVMSLDMNIQHGPLLFTDKGLRLGLAYSDITPTVTGLNLNDLDPNVTVNEADLDFTLFAGFDNTLEMSLALPELTVSDPETSLRLLGLAGSLIINSDQSASSRAGFTEFSVSRSIDGSDVAINDFQLETQFDDISQVASPGTASMRIQQITSTVPLPISIDQTQISYALEFSDAQQNLLNFSQLMAVRSMSWDFPLQSLTWDLSVTDVSRELFETYASLMDQAQMLSSGSPSVANSQLQSLSEDFAVALLRDRLGLNSTLDVNAFDTDHRIEVMLAWQGLPRLSNFNSIDIGEAIKALEVSITVDADDAALSLSPLASMLDQYKEQGLLMVNNGRLQLLARLGNGELVVNEESLPLDQIFSF